ncbi:lipoyl amidotransferase LIPT1, mitochondrial-like isoform X2 [Haliotis asinina]|uniref:lipoyl amidotransferase LIPT1, mitochondrial-like isoform X2 n=1 Tax=Haliotis asinina TaxID=109174 RepID=UPI00353192B4
MLIHKLFCCPQNSRQFLRSVLKRWTWANTHALPHIANYPKQYTTAAPEHVVYVSRSKNIFENLALEDWIYQNGDLENRSYLLMWSNGPAVVLGLHQNPWMECNVDRILAENVDLARRKSGGGTVYHDEGNLNLSFIKSRPRYNRKENLELVKRALAHKWDVDLSINCREDLILDGFFKVSGTAAKLGGHRTYHHFTLLVDVDVERLTTLLQSPMVGVKSKSTESVPANVRNLVESAPSMDIPSIVQCIGDQFLHHNIPQAIWASPTSSLGLLTSSLGLPTDSPGLPTSSLGLLTGSLDQSTCSLGLLTSSLGLPTGTLGLSTGKLFDSGHKCNH